MIVAIGMVAVVTVCTGDENVRYSGAVVKRLYNRYRIKPLQGLCLKGPCFCGAELLL